MSSSITQKNIIYTPVFKLWNWLSTTPYFSVIITSLYTVLLLFGIAHHEIWRDEMQAWLVSRDSASLGDLLFTNLKYEGTPAFWYICLFGISRFTHNPIAMQLLNVGFMVISIYLLTQFAPLSRLQKILFIFGYFPLFEYGIISRNYSGGILFCFCFCLLYPLRHKSYLSLALILALLSHTSAYGLLMSTAFAGLLGLDLLLMPQQPIATILKARFWDISLSALLILIASVSSGLSMIPPADRGWGTDVTLWSPFKIFATLAVLWDAFIPIPFPTYHFWNSNIIQLRSPNLTVLLRDIGAIGIWTLVSAFFIRKPIILGLFILGSLEIFAFTYIKWYGFMRHYGHLYILFISCLWLSQYYPNQTYKDIRSSFINKIIVSVSAIGQSQWLEKSFIIGTLGLHVVAGVFCYGMDQLFPFSDSKAASQLIQQQIKSEPTFLIGDPDYLISPLAGYLNTKIYYPTVGEFGSFWQTNIYKKKPSQPDVLREASHLIDQRRESAILILTQPLQTKAVDFKLTAQPLDIFDHSFLWSYNFFWPLDAEHYYVYRIRRAL